MNDFTQKVIATSLNILEYAISHPQGSAVTLVLVQVAQTLLTYAIAFDPAPDMAAQAERMRLSLKATTDALAAAVQHSTTP